MESDPCELLKDLLRSLRDINWHLKDIEERVRIMRNTHLTTDVDDGGVLFASVALLVAFINLTRDHIIAMKYAVPIHVRRLIPGLNVMNEGWFDPGPDRPPSPFRDMDLMPGVHTVMIKKGGSWIVKEVYTVPTDEGGI